MPDEYVPGETKKSKKKTPKQFKSSTDFDSYYGRTGKAAIDVGRKKKGKHIKKQMQKKG